MSWFGVKKCLNLRFWPKNQPQLQWRPFFFFFWRPPDFGLKNRLISLNFGEDLFFLETTWFWAEKSFELQSFPRNSVSIFGQTLWNWFKSNENLGRGRLPFSHSFKKAPPFSKSWLRACVLGRMIYRNASMSNIEFDGFNVVKLLEIRSQTMIFVYPF